MGDCGLGVLMSAGAFLTQPARVAARRKKPLQVVHGTGAACALIVKAHVPLCNFRSLLLAKPHACLRTCSPIPSAVPQATRDAAERLHQAAAGPGVSHPVAG